MDALLDACCKYLADSLKQCTAPWAWLVFTIAHQLHKKDLMTAAATQLASKALTDNSCITHCSAALRAMERNPKELLKVLRAGVSSAVHGATPSEALLLVLLMRLDQLADDKDLPGAASATLSGPSTPTAAEGEAGAGRVIATEAAAAAADSTTPAILEAAVAAIAASSSHSPACSTSDTGCSVLLAEDVLSALVKLVEWGSLHHAEVKALINQATSYSKATAAAMCCNHQLLQQAACRLGKPFDSLPPGQTTARYLACWCNTSEQKPGALVECTLLGHNRLQSGSIEVACYVQMNRDSLGMQGVCADLRETPTSHWS